MVGTNNNIEASYKLSPMQQAMLFHYQLAPDSGVYILQLVFTFHETLNTSALKKAWEHILSRHDILRTAFRWEGLEEPLQDVYVHVEAPFETHDWTNLSASEQKNRFDEFIKTDRKKVFDLAKAPVMRFTLFHLASDKFKLVWTYHHGILDGACHPVLLDELFQYYEAICEGREISLPENKPYRSYIEWFYNQDPGKSEEYWRQTLAGLKSTGVFTRLSASNHFITSNYNFKEIEFRIPEKTTKILQDFGQKNQVSLNNIVQGAWALLLTGYGEKEDIIFGTVRAGRHWGTRDNDSMVGLFIYTVPMRVVAAPDKMLVPWLREIKQSQFLVRDHEAVPIETIRSWTEIPRGKPLFDSIVSFQGFYLTTLFQSRGGKWLNREFYWIVDNGYPITLYGNVSSELILKLSYDGNKFDDATINWIMEDLKKILGRIAENPDQSLRKLAAASHAIKKTDIKQINPVDKSQQQRIVDRTAARRALIIRRQQIKQNGNSPEPESQLGVTQAQPAVTITVSATFTAESIAETMDFWSAKLGRPFKVEFAPYNQVFQQLLNPASLLLKNSSGVNVVLVRFEDWIRDDKTSESAKKLEKIKENADHFIEALQSASGQSAAHYLVCICPVSPAVSENGQDVFYQKVEERVYDGLSDIGNISFIKSSAIIGRYGIKSYYDAYSDELGHMPYTPEFFASLATMITREIYAIYNPPKKVIVLDCDQTLWKGICGEDGPMGIEIDEPRKKLQEFMVEQYNAGVLICLCSKNNEEDVDEVFKYHPEMPLKQEYITLRMINWRSKSENIKALAARLELGLDSFIFIDDSPVECNEVQTFLPEVLTLCLPDQAEKIPGFLMHVWAFDHLKITEEDKKRTSLYRQEEQRKDFQEQSMSLADFIAGLKLNVKIAPPMPEHIVRVAQLTQRTNQFNLTTIRRSEAEIQKLCQAGELECLITEVSDRFGEYGLVGVLLFKSNADAIKVDTFLLSCRAMGRGVEHQMLNKLGALAKERGLGYVEVPYMPTSKNQPAHDFIDSIASRYKQPLDSGFIYRLPAEYTAGINYVPGIEKPAAGKNGESRVGVTPAPSKQMVKFDNASEISQNIAMYLNDAEEILKAIALPSKKQGPKHTGKYMVPGSEIERSLTGIWKKVLGIDDIGINDNFFEIGGTSLKGVLLISQINRDFKTNIPVIALFEKPTISSMAAMLAEEIENSATNSSVLAK